MATCRSTDINLVGVTCANADKHPFLQVCECPANCAGNMDGSYEKPYDNLFQALYDQEVANYNKQNIEIEFIFRKTNDGDVPEFPVIMNELFTNAGGSCILSPKIDETNPLFFFARK